MKKWEYFKADISLPETYLNEVGENGWELVTHTAVYKDGKGVELYIFKREKWLSQIYINGKTRFLGYFEVELKASEKYQSELKNI